MNRPRRGSIHAAVRQMSHYRRLVSPGDGRDISRRGVDAFQPREHLARSSTPSLCKHLLAAGRPPMPNRSTVLRTPALVLVGGLAAALALTSSCAQASTPSDGTINH